ncbi:amino acid permease [Citricoccus zhacaiensis]|uniref:Amino acid permease n=1 Tax=Citricoccus zhacaiensis TaxID=489142 RepID=A0ABQ2LPX6_9MICC|nr:APC family permease [Citricoccus zhacaiensis]GGO41671.1 amino acid permease [Citricoccus zhacaiensis]
MSTTTPDVPSAPPEEGEGELKRVLGPKLLLLFIVGDVLGAGIYAVTGEMAGMVGGILWLPFLLAFAVATMTAFSYLELVTHYPQAAGAALYTHKAFGIHFVTFLVAFAVVCSGITSASTSANVLAQNFFGGLEVNGWMGEAGPGAVMGVALGFMVLLALINLRGVGESIKFNVVLTLVEMTALCIVIGVGFFAMAQGGSDLSQIFVFQDNNDKGLFLAVTAATSIAFFAMVGFEDSVNMVEETKDPIRIFPRTMLTGLGIAVLFYMLVAISAVAVLSPTELSTIGEAEGEALLEVVKQGSPGFPVDRIFPFLAVFAVANTALINMLMASRLVYGMAKQNVLPRPLGQVLRTRRTPWVAIIFTTVLALFLIWYVTSDPESNIVTNLSSTTALLLLCVFTVVNVACIVLRRRRGAEPESGSHSKRAFNSPAVLPYLAGLFSLFLAGPWVDRDRIVYQIAGGLMVLGIALWVLTYFLNKASHRKRGAPVGDVLIGRDEDLPPRPPGR